METLWFIIWGILWSAYFLLDGYDLGAGSLMPVIAKSEEDRKKIFNAIGPFWDGNEVWLVTAGGVTFAAFPGTYATMFSALYTALMLVLFALILRGAGIALREEAENTSARKVWDAFFVIGSFIAALLFGVFFANIFKGIPIDADGVFQGNLFTLLNLYGLMGGLLFLAFFLMHGSIWLALKTEGDLHNKVARLARQFWLVLMILFVIFLIYTAFVTDLYGNYLSAPILFLVPIISAAGLILSGISIKRASWAKAWTASSVFVFFLTFFGLIGIYPNLLPSTIDPSFSRTIYNTASSPLTLKIMFVVAVIFVPLVILYQAWSYKLFAGKVSGEHSAYGDG